jgi:hypothetical protein
MVLALMPAPPMPCIVSLQLGGENHTTTGHAANSHDLLAHFINLSSTALLPKDRTALDLMKERQGAALKKLVDAADSSPDEGVMWEAFGAYIREELEARLGGKQIDLRFLSMASVGEGGAIHKAAVSHSIGHDHLYGPLPGAEGVLGFTYRELVCRSWARIRSSKEPPEVVDPGSGVEIIEACDDTLPEARFEIIEACDGKSTDDTLPEARFEIIEACDGKSTDDTLPEARFETIEACDGKSTDDTLPEARLETIEEFNDNSTGNAV